MTRDELMDLAERILTTEEDDEVLSDLMGQFDRNVPHPEGSSLLFYPEGWDARNGSLAGYAPTAEDVVDTCLAYRPICL